ncbi:MAG: hypothetical protein RBR75_05900, partial [Acholeplasmataceae bacterium]|nr:hypothetical protein [Acholeplasmataceae bacterium]
IVLLIAFTIFGDLNVPVWLLFSFAPFILQIIFASLSFLISIFVIKSRKVISISLGIVIGMYVIDLISKLTEEFEYLKYITPYEYINAVTIVKDEMIKPIYLLISVLMIGVSLTCAWYFYRKKDITT